ncbi:LOW QUALITY PROTEIN: hypothetical protein U9M48_012816 [Paspalum notatum var. saurae]|uniref:Uncharacterized protein n=1 Tax=Paspalum notatum var. saurae TaxID=547442 RepID=A0AAQ3T0Z6_PASNO
MAAPSEDGLAEASKADVDEAVLKVVVGAAARRRQQAVGAGAVAREELRQAVVNTLERKLFYIPSIKIYHGVAGLSDYGRAGGGKHILRRPRRIGGSSAADKSQIKKRNDPYNNMQSGDQNEPNLQSPTIHAKERKRQRDRERYASMSVEKRKEINKKRREARQRNKGRPIILGSSTEDMDTDTQQLHINQTSEVVNIEASGYMPTGSDDLMRSQTNDTSPNANVTEHKRQRDIERCPIMSIEEICEINKKRREVSTEENMDPCDNSDWLHRNEAYSSKNIKTSGHPLTPGGTHETAMMMRVSSSKKILTRMRDTYLQGKETNEDMEIDGTQDDFESIPEVPGQYDKVYSNIP